MVYMVEKGAFSRAMINLLVLASLLVGQCVAYMQLKGVFDTLFFLTSKGILKPLSC